MPRKEIDIDCRVEHLSVLTEEGRPDRDMEPEIPDGLLLKLYRAIVLGRRFDERMLTLQRQGRIGTFAPLKGQEAAQLGAVAALEDRDWLVPAFRETAAEVWRGKKLENVLLMYAGYNEGGYIEPETKNLPVAIPVGTQMLHAVGIAMGMQYRESDGVVMTFFGDGATSEGDFHEALNFAGLFQAPVVFICQNNHWAISIPRSRQSRSKTLAQKAIAYGLPGIQVDGNDILAVYGAAREAVDRARSGNGPTLIECITYRLSMHTTADDPKRYRKDAEVKEWEGRDPLNRFQNYLIGRNLLSHEKIAELEADVKNEIKSALERFNERAAQANDSLNMFDHVYDQLPPYLEAQRSELQQELETKKKAES